MATLPVYRRWAREHHEAIMPLVALGLVVGFWAVGLGGGISYLHSASSLMTMIGGLYVMLAAVALSIIVATAALSHLAHHFSRRRTH